MTRQDTDGCIQFDRRLSGNRLDPPEIELLPTSYRRNCFLEAFFSKPQLHAIAINRITFGQVGTRRPNFGIREGHVGMSGNQFADATSEGLVAKNIEYKQAQPPVVRGKSLTYRKVIHLNRRGLSPRLDH